MKYPFMCRHFGHKIHKSYGKYDIFEFCLRLECPYQRSIPLQEKYRELTDELNEAYEKGNKNENS